MIFLFQYPNRQFMFCKIVCCSIVDSCLVQFKKPFVQKWGKIKHGVMGKLQGIVVSEFDLQSCYYVHFRTNTLRKGINPLILPAMS